MSNSNCNKKHLFRFHIARCVFEAKEVTVEATSVEEARQIAVEQRDDGCGWNAYDDDPVPFVIDDQYEKVPRSYCNNYIAYHSEEGQAPEEQALPVPLDSTVVVTT